MIVTATCPSVAVTVVRITPAASVVRVKGVVTFSPAPTVIVISFLTATHTGVRTPTTWVHCPLDATTSAEVTLRRSNAPASPPWRSIPWGATLSQRHAVAAESQGKATRWVCRTAGGYKLHRTRCCRGTICLKSTDGGVNAVSDSEPSSQAQLIAVLATAPLFAALNLPLLEALAAVAVRAHYGPQQVVFLAGTPDDSLYVIAHGWLKSLKSTAEGREQTLALFGPGEVFNLAVLADVPTQATVIALEPVTLWRLPRARLHALIATHPELAHALIRGLVARVIRLSKLVEDLTLHPVEARLARLLLQRATGDEVVRRQWATQAELAAQLGTVPDVLNRALRSLVAARLIVVQRQRIRILDHAGLVARAQFT